MTPVGIEWVVCSPVPGTLHLRDCHLQEHDLLPELFPSLLSIEESNKVGLAATLLQDTRASSSQAGPTADSGLGSFLCPRREDRIGFRSWMQLQQARNIGLW